MEKDGGPMGLTERAVEDLQTNLGDAVVAIEVFRADTTVEIASAGLLAAARRLRQSIAPPFDLLAGLTASDSYPEDPRFSLIYVFYSTGGNAFVRLRARLPGKAPEIESLEPVYPAANWHEREVFDLFGITFRGHSDLRRILLPHDWVGHPLRKDHPLGYEEVQFSFNFDEIDRRKPYAQE